MQDHSGAGIRSRRRDSLGARCEARTGRFLGLVLGLALVAPTGPAAAEESVLRGGDLGRGSQDCKSSEDWSSRVEALLHTSKLDCDIKLPLDQLDLRVSYFRRGARSDASSGDLGWSLDDFERHAAASVANSFFSAPDSESEAELEIGGSWNDIAYEAGVKLAHEVRFAPGSLVPERRSVARVTGGWELGMFKPRFELSRSQTSEGLAPDDPLKTVSNGRLFLDLAIPDLPVVTLGVGREIKKIDVGGERPEEVGSDVLSLSLWYGNDHLQAYSVSSAYRIDNESGRESALYDQYVGASFWPTPSLTVNPGFQYMVASYDGGGSWTHTRSASLGIYSSELIDGLTTTLWSAYTANEDTIGSIDNRQIDFSLGLEKEFTGRLSPFESYQVSVGFSFGYSFYNDFVYSRGMDGFATSLFTIRIYP